MTLLVWAGPAPFLDFFCFIVADIRNARSAIAASFFSLGVCLSGQHLESCPALWGYHVAWYVRRQRTVWLSRLPPSRETLRASAAFSCFISRTTTLSSCTTSCVIFLFQIIPLASKLFKYIVLLSENLKRPSPYRSLPYATTTMSAANFCLALLAVIFPPFPVWVKRGLCSADSLINLALCCLGFVPGLLHAWYVIATTPHQEYEPVVEDLERAPLGSQQTYYIVHQQPEQQAQSTPGYTPRMTGLPGQPTKNPSKTYGTVAASRAHAGEGSSEVPPTYDQVIKGDNKIQRL